MKIYRRTLFQALIISAVVIVAFDAIALYTLWSAQQEFLEQMPSTPIHNKRFREDVMQQEFLIIVTGIAISSISWFFVLTLICYGVIDALKSGEKRISIELLQILHR